MKQALLFISIIFVISSCRGKVHCKDGTIGQIIMYRGDTSVPITDTSVTVFSYIQNGQFSYVTDSLSCAINTGGRSIYLSCTGGRDFVSHDWKLRLNPSGKEYRITDTRYNKRDAWDQYDSYVCYSDIAFTCNNKHTVIESISDYTYIAIDY